jgi:hypothetical protein
MLLLISATFSAHAGEISLLPVRFPAGQDHVTIPCTRASCFLMAPIQINDQDAGLLVVDTARTG